MKNASLRALLAATVSALALASLPLAPAFAHHSFAMYDGSKPLVLSATVKELQWSNPHVILWLTADPKPGQKEGEVWIVELSTSTGPLSRLGWSKHSLVPGDKVLVEINPLRSGELGGQFRKATIVKTGVVLTTALPNPDEVALPASAAAK